MAKDFFVKKLSGSRSANSPRNGGQARTQRGGDMGECPPPSGFLKILINHQKLWLLGAVQLLRNAFFGQFWPPLPLVTKCHTGPNPPPPPHNVTLVCRPGLKPVMLKKEYIITSKILMIYTCPYQYGACVYFPQSKCEAFARASMIY